MLLYHAAVLANLLEVGVQPSIVVGICQLHGLEDAKEHEGVIDMERPD